MGSSRPNSAVDVCQPLRLCVSWTLPWFTVCRILRKGLVGLYEVSSRCCLVCEPSSGNGAPLPLPSVLQACSCRALTGLCGSLTSSLWPQFGASVTPRALRIRNMSDPGSWATTLAPELGRLYVSTAQG